MQITLNPTLKLSGAFMLTFLGGGGAENLSLGGGVKWGLVKELYGKYKTLPNKATFHPLQTRPHSED